MTSFERMVRPKKFLGQHFLKDQDIARKIAESLSGHGEYSSIIEIGPGTGVLTRYLMDSSYSITLVEIDFESVAFLKNSSQFGDLQIIEADFLKMDLEFLRSMPHAIIGNFPYNISSQLFFRILDFHNSIPEVVCMIQKEVAERIASPPGSKKYGILSVLLQAYYDIEYLFTVPPIVFQPAPKVDSGVIRLKRNKKKTLACDEKLFRKIVKGGFQNRRKTLRNALKPLNLPDILAEFDMISHRAEQLAVEDFVRLTQLVEDHGTPLKV